MKRNNCNYATISSTSYPKRKTHQQIKSHKTLSSPVQATTITTHNTSNANLLGSFSTSTVTTTTSQLKSTHSKSSLAKLIPLLTSTKPKEEESSTCSYVTNHANSLLSKSKNKHNLQIQTHNAITNSDLNDTHLEDLLEIEGKKILNKLSNTFKMTTQGNFIINTKMYLHNTKQNQLNTFNNEAKAHNNEIKERDFISNLINSRCKVSQLPLSRKGIINKPNDNTKTTDNNKLSVVDTSSFISSRSNKTAKRIHSQVSSQHVNVCNTNHNKHQSEEKKIQKEFRRNKYNNFNSKTNEGEIMNLLIQSTYEKTKNKKVIQHNKIKSFPCISSSKGKVLQHVGSNKSIKNMKRTKNN